MYQMKAIINHSEDMVLPKCMYNLKPIYSMIGHDSTQGSEEINLNISKQVTKLLQVPNNKMAELERRQDQLLKKLDILMDRIKTISLMCSEKSIGNSQVVIAKSAISAPDEIVLVCSPDNLPLFIQMLKNTIGNDVNLTWHIHSSVASEKVNKIKAFVKTLPSLRGKAVTLRLIFKNVSVDSELKLSCLDMPIVGNVNILRYLALVYPNAVPYPDDPHVDSILDLCHVLERTTEKNKEAIVKNIFAKYNCWISNNMFTIVDIAAFNVIKQWKNCPKYVPKDWVEKCEKLLK